MPVKTGKGAPSQGYQLLLAPHLGWQNGVRAGLWAFSLLAGYAKDGSILPSGCPIVS